MTTLEDDLIAHLERRADAVTVAMTAADVRSHGAVGASRWPLRRSWIAGAAAAVVVVSVGALALRGASDRSDETISTPDSVVLADPPAPSPDTLRIAPAAGISPQRLAADALVFEAEGVGVIEVGPPSVAMVEERPDLEGADCVATSSGYACQQDTDTGPQASTSSSSGGFALTTSRLTPAGTFVFVEQGGAQAVVVSGLDPGVVSVEIEAGGLLWRQTPVDGTVAVPFDPSAPSVHLRAVGSDGSLIWTESLTMPRAELPAEPAAEGAGSIRVAPGATVADVVELIDSAGLPFDGEDFVGALTEAGLARFDIGSEPSDTIIERFEGFVSPGLYRTTAGSSATELVELMARRFEVVAAQTRLDEAEELVGLSPGEALTIASLIEAETSTPSEQRRVARVIYNRLAVGEPIGIDASLVYALGREVIAAADLDSESPYNLRRFAGLPPGPIGSPSPSAIEAALDPSEGDWFFFVPTDDGLQFATTLEELSELVEAAREAG